MRRRRWRRRLAAARLVAVMAMGLLLGGAARAATVVVVRPPRPTPVTTEAIVRLSGELVSAGFDVRVVDQPRGSDVRTSLEEAAAGPDVEAVVAILGTGSYDISGDAGDAAELWVIDRVTGKAVVRRIPAQPAAPRAAEALSIRALELLRASFLEVALAAGRRPKARIPKPPTEAVKRFAEAPLEEALEDQTRLTSHWAVEVGGCVLGSAATLGNDNGIPASLLPLVRVQRRFDELVFVRLGLAGLGTESHPAAPGGTADVSQQFGLFEGGLRFRPQAWLQPVLSLGVGGLHVAAAGQSSRPYQGASGDRWALLVDVGAGLRIGLRGRFELTIEGHAQTAHPYPTIRFIDTTVASEGRLSQPILLGSVGVAVWL